MENKNMFAEMIGKPVIVRSRVAGVHAGIAESIEGTTAVLRDSHRFWRYFTRDITGSISDVAVNGLVDGKDHQIGARIERTAVIEGPESGLEIAQMTEAAWESVKAKAHK